jgi:hypothetical protein
MYATIEPQGFAIDIGVFKITNDFDAIGNSSATPRPLATISLSSLLELLGGDRAVVVLVEPAEELGSTLEFVLLHFAILIRVVACRELLESETASAWSILLGLLGGGSDMDERQEHEKWNGYAYHDGILQVRSISARVV